MLKIEDGQDAAKLIPEKLDKRILPVSRCLSAYSFIKGTQFFYRTISEEIRKTPLLEVKLNSFYLTTNTVTRDESRHTRPNRREHNI